MKSCLNISDCLLRINESINLDLNSLEEEYRNQALKELRYVIKKTRNKNPRKRGEPIIHVSARRLHFYGKIGVFHPAGSQSKYKIWLPEICWITTDYNAPQNEIFVSIESEEK